MIALATPTLGLKRELWVDKEGTRTHVVRVDFSPADRDGQQRTYLWTENGAAASRVLESGRARIELDPGSGPSDLRVVRVRQPATVASVCAGFRAQTRAQIQREIADGSIPSFVTMLPFRMPACQQGALWESQRTRT